MSTRAYAAAGVDSSKIDLFKKIMGAMGRRTLIFPQTHHGITVRQFAHGAGYEMRQTPYMVMTTQEGLGNKTWIAEWMYQYAGTGRTYYDGIGIDALLMAANDVSAHGARPFMFVDEVASPDSDWFTDEKRGQDLAESFYRACETDGIALPAGESPSLPYLMQSKEPVKSAPSLSGCITGYVKTPDQLITGEKICAGAHIIGVTSSGLHANGISLVIQQALNLPDKFLTKLPNGNTLGEEALIPTRSYVKLVSALLDNEVDILGFLPGTGDGVAKLASHPRNFTHHLHSWVPIIPPLFLYLHEVMGITLFECLKTFNWGVGDYIFAYGRDVDRIIRIGQKAGYELYDIGLVLDGPRQTIFGPAGNLILPPGDA